MEFAGIGFLIGIVFWKSVEAIRDYQALVKWRRQAGREPYSSISVNDFDIEALERCAKLNPLEGHDDK